MFVKVSKSKNYSYVQIISAIRENGVSKHKVVANLGRFDSLVGNQILINLANKLLAATGSKKKEPFCIKEIDRFSYGDIVYRKFWNKLKIDVLLLSVAKKRKFRFMFTTITYLMVISRLLKPESKLSLFLKQNKYINIQKVELQNIYRTLDILAESKDEIEKYLYERQLTLFSMDVDIVFYDITTFHFESQTKDLIRDFGFSKANKVNEVQILFGLIINKEGRPLGYNIFKGNMSESKTMKTLLEKLKEKFSINKIIIVSDKGLSNYDNLKAIRQTGYDYIISGKIKTFSAEMKEKILKKDNYIEIRDSNNEVVYKYKIISPHKREKKESGKVKQQQSNKLIIIWSKARAKADMKKRERQVEKAKDRIKDKDIQIVNKKGANRYIHTEGEIKINGIDEVRITEESKWDGYYGIETTEETISNETVISNYHMLWKIEESFRVLKSTFESRPIFHWTPKRIEGHFVICFIAFLIERSLELTLKEKDIKYSTEKIKESINSLELSEIEIEDVRYYLRGRSDELSNQILSTLRIKKPNHLTQKEEYQGYNSEIEKEEKEE